VNDRFNQLIQYSTSGIGCWISFIMIAFILGTFGLGWLINGFLIFLAVLFVTPVIAFWGFQWWLRRKLIQDKCPVCSYEFTGFKNTEFQCPSCGEVLQVEAEHFKKMTPPGTIDIDAVEVSVQRIEE
jgi:predicted RNA-binding Zn-ribbon protein involved in translation (DUF1610 family)